MCSYLGSSKFFRDIREIFLLIQVYKNPGQNINKCYNIFDSPKVI